MSSTPHVETKLKAASVEPVDVSAEYLVRGISRSICPRPSITKIMRYCVSCKGRLAFLTCKKSDEVFNGHKIPNHPIHYPHQTFRTH